MRFIGILGIISLLGLGFLLSNNRSRIKPRIIIWGLSLQFLFAAIILGKGWLSFSAMLLFLGMLIIYMFKEYVNKGESREKQIFRLVAIVAGILLVSGLLYFIRGLGITGWIFWLALAAIFILPFFKLHKYQRILASIMLLSGFVWLVSNGMTGDEIFHQVSLKVKKFLSLSDLGAEFLFGNLAIDKYFFPDTNSWPGFGSQFAFTVLPVIIFFSAFMSILYHLGIMQKVVIAMAKFMKWTLGTSGAETLSCSSNIFVGQTEAPLLIKPFLENMTKSELMTIMVGGFATIAGGVLAGYIAMGIPAGHLIAASVMSAPAAIVMGKILFPETKESETAGDVKIPSDIIKSSNLLDAASQGVTDGLKLAVNVGAMLIAFIALIGLLDLILNFADKLIDGSLLNGTYVNYKTVSSMSPVKGEYAGIFPGSIKTFFGTIFRPLAWLMGVSWQNAAEVGNLLGIKLTLTEFVAYGSLADLIQQGAISTKAEVVSTYALCGFANFASIGIQIGGISALAPSRRADLSSLALKAMFGGAFASWITAAIAGILL
mgnify:CR=1 FL=1